MTSSVCPFCKGPVPSSARPCPRCGKLASDHPSVAQTQGRTLDTDWDDDAVPDLRLDESPRPPANRGVASQAPSTNPYEQGGHTLGDDFDDDFGQGGALELDVPMGHGATAPRPPHGGSLAPNQGSPSSSRAPRPLVSRASAPPSSSSRAPAPPNSNHPARRSGSHGAVSHPPGSSPGAIPSAAPSGDPSQPSMASKAPAEPSPAAPADPAAIVARFPNPPNAVWQAPGYALKVLWRQFELRQDLTSLRRRRSPDVPLYERALKTHDPKAFALGLALTGAMFVMVTFIVFLPVIIRYINKPPD